MIADRGTALEQIDGIFIFPSPAANQDKFWRRSAVAAHEFPPHMQKHEMVLARLDRAASHEIRFVRHCWVPRVAPPKNRRDGSRRNKNRHTGAAKGRQMALECGFHDLRRHDRSSAETRKISQPA